MMRPETVDGSANEHQYFEGEEEAGQVIVLGRTLGQPGEHSANHAADVGQREGEQCHILVRVEETSWELHWALLMRQAGKPDPVDRFDGQDDGNDNPPLHHAPPPVVVSALPCPILAVGFRRVESALRGVVRRVQAAWAVRPAPQGSWP